MLFVGMLLGRRDDPPPLSGWGETAGSSPPDEHRPAQCWTSGGSGAEPDRTKLKIKLLMFCWRNNFVNSKHFWVIFPFKATSNVSYLQVNHKLNESLTVMNLLHGDWTWRNTPVITHIISLRHSWTERGTTWTGGWLGRHVLVER